MSKLFARANDRQTGRADHQARSLAQSPAMAQPGVFANALTSNYGNYTQGAAGAYQGYAGAMGNAVNAMSNERSNLYGANAMAEAARMGAVGNIGSAGLGAAGSAANASMDAWARNQQAYNQSAATMQMANQSGLSNFGAADVNARSRAGIAASLMGGMGGTGGTFSAGGLGGPVASGSFSGGGGGIGGGGGAIDSTMQSELARQSDAGRAQLDSQHYSSRGMPSQMLDQGLSGLTAMSGQSLGAVGQGMDQFYGNQQRASDQFMPGVNRALDGLSGQLSNTQGGMASGMQDSNNRIDGLFDRSLGNFAMFQTPAQATQQARDNQMLMEQNSMEDSIGQAQQILREPPPLPPNPAHGASAISAYQQNLESYRFRQQQAQRTLAGLTG